LSFSGLSRITARIGTPRNSVGIDDSLDMILEDALSDDEALLSHPTAPVRLIHSSSSVGVSAAGKSIPLLLITYPK
jgi:hypothetical protein